MSYDIHLFMPRVDEDLLVTARRDEEDYDRPLSEAAKVRNAAAVAALLEINPGLEIREGEGFVQIYDAHGKTGISIELNDTSGAITIPYWHKTEAANILSMVSNYLRAVHQVTGFAAYDPQSESLLDPMNFNGLSLELYAGGVDALSRARGKPWWKFW